VRPLAAPSHESAGEHRPVTQTTGRGPERIRASTAADTQVAAPSTRLDLWAWLSRPGRAEILIALLSAALFSWRVERASPWFDEAITRDVTSRSASEIVGLAEHVDLVHTAYYLLVHAVLGTSESVTPIRMLSVVAAALTAVLLVRLGRELGSAHVGVLAGLLWTLAPLVSRYAQEARPYAMVALAATATTLALVRFCRRPWLPGRAGLYAVSLVVLGLLNVLALLLLVVHLTYVLATSAGTIRRRWALSVAGALVVLSPMLIASAGQSEQVSWLPRPHLEQLTGFLLAEYAVGLLVLALLALAIAGLGRGTHSPALGLGLSWALLPPVILWTVSQAHPLFDWRYVFFAVPGTALALASLATLLRWRWLAVMLLVLAIGGSHMQNVYRYRASGHAEDLRGAAQAIEQGSRPGDAVLFLPESRRVVEQAFPDDFRGVDDVSLARTAEESATLLGVEVPPDELAAALKGRHRVWLVTGPARYGETPSRSDREKERLLYNGYRLTGVTFVRSYEVRLYERGRLTARTPAAAAAAGVSS
jgi:mannosyltransferase